MWAIHPAKSLSGNGPAIIHLQKMKTKDGGAGRAAAITSLRMDTLKAKNCGRGMISILTSIQTRGAEHITFTLKGHSLTQRAAP